VGAETWANSRFCLSGVGGCELMEFKEFESSLESAREPDYEWRKEAYEGRKGELCRELQSPDCSPERFAEVYTLISANQERFPAPASIVTSVKEALVSRFGLDEFMASDIAQDAFQRHTGRVRGQIGKN